MASVGRTAQTKRTLNGWSPSITKYAKK